MPLTAQPPSQYLIDLVGALGGSWSGYRAMCRCPSHADATPSLSLRQGDRGILVHCFAGCEAVDVLRDLKVNVPGKRYKFNEDPSRAFDSSAIARRIWTEGQSAGGTLAEAYTTFRKITGTYDDLRFQPICRRCFPTKVSRRSSGRIW